MIHFNAELWNIHQLSVLQDLNEKEIIPIGKVEKKWPKKKSLLLHSSGCHDII